MVDQFSLLHIYIIAELITKRTCRLPTLALVNKAKLYRKQLVNIYTTRHLRVALFRRRQRKERGVCDAPGWSDPLRRTRRCLLHSGRKTARTGPTLCASPQRRDRTRRPLPYTPPHPLPYTYIHKRIWCTENVSLLST